MKVAALFFLLSVTVLPAQRKMEPKDMYHRIIAVVGLQGAGTEADPIRPLYAPAPRRPGEAPGAGIIAYAYQMSDDGKSALVEFVARDRSALSAILSDPRVKVFERKGGKQDDIEKELRKYKKDFDWDKFGAVAP